MKTASSFTRMGNIIRLSNVHFDNPVSNKKIWTEQENFFGSPIINNAPALGGTHWITDGMGTNYDDYSYIAENNYAGGVITFAKPIDIVEKHDNGAKYIYVLGTIWQKRSDGSVAMNHGSINMYKIVNGTCQNVVVNTAFDIINQIPGSLDENIAAGGLYNAFIYEAIYDLDALISEGATGALCGCINYSVGAYPKGISIYPNSAIDKPIVIWVYEEQ